MRRPWQEKWESRYMNARWEQIIMPGYYPVSVYKDTTAQFTDAECDADNVVEIPVPENLLLSWFREAWNIDRDFDRLNDEYGYSDEDVISDLKTWVYEESTCDDTVNLYGWLCNHNYFWKRLA